jgi:hypothetical protein
VVLEIHCSPSYVFQIPNDRLNGIFDIDTEKQSDVSRMPVPDDECSGSLRNVGFVLLFDASDRLRSLKFIITYPLMMLHLSILHLRDIES